MKHVFLHQDSIVKQAIQSTTYEPYSAHKKEPQNFYNKGIFGYSSVYRGETSASRSSQATKVNNGFVSIV